MTISSAYREAISLSSSHYENFPVASFLIKKELRKHIAIIYWFARTADDFADEGDLSSEMRLKLLDEFKFRFEEIIAGRTENAMEEALLQTIKEMRLSPNYFTDLLSAFRQDVVQKRYTDFRELADYCGRSANPVGRLILELYNIREDLPNYFSDQICTGLQLTNFYQDIGIDYEKGRIYIPVSELNEFSVNESEFSGKKISENLRQLLKFSVERNLKLYEEGKNLLPYLTDKRLKFEINWTISGGEEILSMIQKNNFDILSKRPKLSKTDFIKLFIKSFL